MKYHLKFLFHYFVIFEYNLTFNNIKMNIFNLSTSIEICGVKNLTEFNSSESEVYVLAASVVLGVCAFLGITCNLTVLLVYGIRMNESKDDRCYIPILSFVEMVASVTVTIEAFLEIWYPIQYPGPILCKAMLYSGILPIFVSEMIILAIAVQRYRKVSVLFATHKERPKIVTAITVIVGIVLCFPVTIFGGIAINENLELNITICSCHRFGGLNFSFGPQIFSALISIITFAGFIIIISLYAKIGYNMRKQYYVSKAIYKRHEENMKNKEIVDALLRDADLYHRNQAFTNEVEDSERNDARERNITFDIDNTESRERQYNTFHRTGKVDMSMFNSFENILEANNSSNPNSRNTTLEKSKRAKMKRHQSLARKRARMRRFTLMFACITVIYSLTSLPGVIMRFLEIIVPGLILYIETRYIWLMPLLYRLCLVRFICNPFIYGCFDRKFKDNFVLLLCRRRNGHIPATSASCDSFATVSNGI